MTGRENNQEVAYLKASIDLAPDDGLLMENATSCIERCATIDTSGDLQALLALVSG